MTINECYELNHRKLPIKLFSKHRQLTVIFDKKDKNRFYGTSSGLDGYYANGSDWFWELTSSVKSQPAPEKVPCSEQDNFEHLDKHEKQREMDKYYDKLDYSKYADGLDKGHYKGLSHQLEGEPNSSSGAEPSCSSSSGEQEPKCSCQDINWGVHEDSCAYMAWRKKKEESDD